MENNITIDNVSLCYEETGNPLGQPVLIMHGWGCNHTTVKSLASVLEDDYRVISVDLPGHGKSEEPSEIWGSEDFADIIEKLIKLLDLKHPSIIGHSFGGRIGIVVASRNDIEKLILVDSAGIVPRRSLKYYFKVYSFKLMKNILFTIYGKEKGGKKVEKLRGKKGSADYRNSSPVMRGVMSKCVNEDLKPLMPKINCPTLLIWGDEDTATPLSDAKTMEKLIPDSGIVSFPGCGHYSFLDNPFGTRRVLKEFFNIR